MSTAAYTKTDSSASFWPLHQEANRQFESIKKLVVSKEMRESTHDEVERALEGAGRELMRLLLQDHLAIRGEGTVPGAVRGADGELRTHHRRRDAGRLVGSIFGPVRLVREAVSGRHASSVHPVDADLNLPRERHTHEVQRRLAQSVSRMSFDAATEQIRQSTGAKPGKRQVEELTIGAARDVEAFYAETRLAVGSEDTGSIGVMSYDSAGIVVKPEDLREATRRAANKPSKLKTRLSQGERRNRKRMAAVAVVHTIKPWHRTAEQVVAGLQGEAEGGNKRPKPENKQVWASVTKPLAAVVEEGFLEANKRDPQHEKSWVALVDGDTQQLEAIKRASKRHKLKLVIILDIIHVIQYLWEAAHVLCGPSTPEAESWVMGRLLRILKGEVGQVVGGIKRSASASGLRATQRKQLLRSAQYLHSHRAYMRYHDYLVAGFPVATGVVEGACRYIVRDRMDITGARWRLPGAEAVLKLRSVIASEDFDGYWAFHCEKEYQRNHGAAYADGKHPTLTYPKRYKHLTLVKAR